MLANPMARKSREPQVNVTYPFTGAVLRMRQEDTLPVIEQYIGQLVNRILYPGFAGEVRGVRLMGLEWDAASGSVGGIIELLIQGVCGRRHVAAMENALMMLDLFVLARLDTIRWDRGLYALLLQVALPAQLWQPFCAAFQAGTALYKDEFRQPTPIVIFDYEDDLPPPPHPVAAPPWLTVARRLTD